MIVATVICERVRPLRCEGADSLDCIQVFRVSGALAAVDRAARCGSAAVVFKPELWQLLQLPGRRVRGLAIVQAAMRTGAPSQRFRRS